MAEVQHAASQPRPGATLITMVASYVAVARRDAVIKKSVVMLTIAAVGCFARVKSLGLALSNPAS